jgi:hypothetical protein
MIPGERGGRPAYSNARDGLADDVAKSSPGLQVSISLRAGPNLLDFVEPRSKTDGTRIFPLEAPIGIGNLYGQRDPFRQITRSGDAVR